MPAIPTAAPTPKTPAQQFFEQAQRNLEYLKMRWEDESEYEDFADYKAQMQKNATPFGITILEAHKRPFGCTFKTPDGGEYRLTITARKYSYARLKAAPADAAKAAPVPGSKLLLILKGTGKSAAINCADFQQCSSATRVFIERNDFGAGCSPGARRFISGDIHRNGVKVGHVSFNGRVWDLAGKEIRL